MTPSRRIRSTLASLTAAATLTLPGCTALQENAAPSDTAAPETTGDWRTIALKNLQNTRQAVVAIGWEPAPPAQVNRRLEAGWIASPDTIITSSTVACEAARGKNLTVRTLDGRTVAAEVSPGPDNCMPWSEGIGILKLSEQLHGIPQLPIRDSPLKPGEPLLAIGHANASAKLGGWLVLAGPHIAQEGHLVWADIGAPINHLRIDEFFGGGYNGAPVTDIHGAIVTILCCERDWAGQLNIVHSPLADPRLRSALTLDEPYFVGGPDPGTLRALVTQHAGLPSRGP